MDTVPVSVNTFQNSDVPQEVTSEGTQEVTSESTTYQPIIFSVDAAIVEITTRYQYIF